MTATINENLVFLTKRRPRKRGGLSAGECVALNLLWRKQVRVPVLAAVFGVSKNTVYSRALTGSAKSYHPDSRRSNTAQDTNDLIDRMGFDEAWKIFITSRIAAAVDEENANLAKRIRKKSKQEESE